MALAPVFTATFTPGGEALVTGGDDGCVYFWDWAAEKLQRCPRGHAHRIWSLALSPDGQMLASAGGDWYRPHQTGELKLWDATTGQVVCVLSGHKALIFSVAFSPDGRTLASASWDGSVRLWDLPAGKERAVLRGPRGRVRSVAFSPDGKTLAAGSKGGDVRLWDAATGAPLGALDVSPAEVNCVAFSPDGRTLAVAEDPPAQPGEARRGRVRLWAVREQQTLGLLAGHRGRVLTLAFAPGGRLLLSGGGAYDRFGEMILWDVGRRAHRLTLHAHRIWVECVAFSPDGRFLVSAGGANGSGEIKVWQAGGSQRAPRRPYGRPALAPPGRGVVRFAHQYSR
jgi:WD40 repeat protein